MALIVSEAWAYSHEPGQVGPLKVFLRNGSSDQVVLWFH